uniref:Cadherin domain-containing protein n=1 Tax=Caenorhabditis japonica TaxID=281687 RepID=A0A8R1DYU5_CAEJA
MTIANVRSDAFKDTDWSDRLVIDRSDLSPGSYLVRLSASLALPVYPSTLKEANIFLTVICNGYAYPLFTVHIDSTNRFAPQFYHEPYVVQLDRNLPPWTIIETPVAAIDWDPADSYKLKFWLEDSHKGFELVDERKPSPGLISGSADWPVAQLPTLIRLKVTGAYDLPMSLRLIVSDGAKDARKSTTFVNLVERLGTGRVEPRTIPTTVTATTTTTSVPTTPTPTTTAVPEVIVDSEITKHEISVPEATTAIIDSEITKKPVQATSTTVTEHRTATTIPPEATINSEITKEPTTNAVTVPSSARTPTSPLPEPIIDSDITKEAVKSTTTTLPEVAIDSEITTTTTTTVTDSKTATSSLAEPIIDSEITTTTTTSFQTDLELIEKLKKSLQTLIPKKIQDDEDQLDAIAFAAKNREMNAIETENLDQIHSVEMENSPTRFTQCSLRTSIPENSVKGTKVAKLEVLNKRNTTKIRLIDPDDTFEIDKQSAEILVKDPKLVDRELFSTLELVAEIENADPSVQCSRIRVYVDLDDENDNRPVFENENYFFHIAKNFPPGREVGKFVAQDIDQGSNGQITYHLLTPDVPFQVGTQGKKGVLMSTGKLDDTIPMYNLIVEARDHGEEVVKSARVPVEVFVLGVKAKVVPTTTTMTTSTDGDDVEVVTEIVEVEMDGESESDNDVEVVTVIEEVVVEEEDLTTQKATTTEANQGSDVKEEEDVSTQNPTSRKEVTQGLDDGEEEATTLRSTTSKITQGVQEDEDEDDEEEKEEEEKGATTQRPTTSKVTQGLEDEEESNEEATKTHRSKTTSKPLESSEEEEEQEPTNTTKNPKRTSTTTKPPPPSEDNNQVDELDETEIETETTTPSPVPDVFSFRQPEYTYDALGMEIKENDLLGKVQAHPNPEFYAMDREVSGIIKINEMGEILAGKNLNRQADGAIKFGVSATNGFETVRDRAISDGPPGMESLPLTLGNHCFSEPKTAK